MSTTALLSVVIPTRSAPPSLARALECLAHQTLPPSDYEVIVVGGVTEAEIWQIVPADITYRVRVFSRPGPSPGLRRNAGAAEAHTNLVLFLDDDMAPEPDLLEAHYQAHVGGDGNRVVIGYLPPTHAIGAKGRSVDWFKAHLRDWWEDVFEEMVRPGHRFCHTDVLSGNLSLPTALFRDVGGFVIPSACREDYELGVRLLQAGAEIIFCPTARSLHEDKTDEKRIIQRKIDEGKADVILARLYPELRSTLVFSSQFSNLFWPGRLLRFLARVWVDGSDRLVALLAPLLGLFENLRLRLPWRLLVGVMLVHAYWRGILSEAKDWNEIRSLATPPPPPPLENIDLACGLQAAAEELDHRRLSGVRFTWRKLPLGAIPYQASAEPVRSRHLCAWLEEKGALAYRRSQALYAALGISDGDAVIDVPNDGVQNRPDLCNSAPTDRLPRAVLEGRIKPAMLTEVDLGDGTAGLAPLLVSVRQRVVVRQGEQFLGWLFLEAQATPRTVSEVLYTMLVRLDDTLLIVQSPEAAPGIRKNLKS